MDRLMIIADDFTGSLDTGIQFTKMGIRTKIVSNYDYDFSTFNPDNSVLVVNTDSRPLSAEEAYRRVYELSVHAKEAGFKYVYKKTDSGLRGNIGSEIKAVMDAYGEKIINFIPAFPRLNRITEGGVALIDGIPVKDSVFGRDPFEPVKYSDVKDIILSQVECEVAKVSKDGQDDINWNPRKPTILLFDAVTNEDLDQIAKCLAENDTYTLCSGCAGFAGSYDKMIRFEKGKGHRQQECDGLLVLCGSVNQISVDQMAYAEVNGFERINLTCEQKLNPAFLDSEEGQKFLDDLYAKVSVTDKYMIDTLDKEGQETVASYAERMNLSNNDIRSNISSTLGRIAKEMIVRGLNYTINITGGDTLMGLMHQIGCTELGPIREIGAGAVLSALNWDGKRIQIISKSGGFGEKDIYLDMYKVVKDYNEE